MAPKLTLGENLLPASQPLISAYVRSATCMVARQKRTRSHPRSSACPDTKPCAPNQGAVPDSQFGTCGRTRPEQFVVRSRVGSRIRTMTPSRVIRCWNKRRGIAQTSLEQRDGRELEERAEGEGEGGRTENNRAPADQVRLEAAPRVS